jgi:hypothetical protein
MKKVIAVARLSMFALGTVNAQTATKPEKKEKAKVTHKMNHHKKTTNKTEKTEQKQAK